MNNTAAISQTKGSSLAPILFTLTIFLSASLLFFVQPLFARLALPQIGGAPAVWTTAMLFFQSVLIAGYVYAHVLNRYLTVRLQICVHLVMWAVALVCLPLAIPAGWSHDATGSTALQTLVLFAMGVGVPFFVLSANAPLIQSWYARSGGPSADDPYFLYGASNLGSLIALLAFPLFAEPLFGISRIAAGFSIGFVALGFFLLTSGLQARVPTVQTQEHRPARKIGAQQTGKWLLLAFIPSSLMLAITSKISTDIGSIPLVWVVPLSLYLLSFVLTFTSRNWLPGPALRFAYLAALAGLGSIFSGLLGHHLSWSGVAILIVSFFVVALFAHRRLYESRPDGANLTLFYVIMSIGGALGGLFNSILAPALFDGLYEGGITTLAAVLLILSNRLSIDLRRAGRGLVTGLAAALPLVIAVQSFGVTDEKMLALVLVALIGLTAIALRNDLPMAAIAAVTLTLTGSTLMPDDTLLRDRSFFGTHRVHDVDGMRLYSNGTTVHGAQRIADIGATRPEPLYYYHRNGPMAQVMDSDIARRAKTVGIVGLGVGSLACYARPPQDWHFYEIDPVVDRVARDPSLFTFLSACTPDAPTYLGDARVVLADQTVTYDLLVIDAYSSDAVPMHLTTTEAMELYIQRLNPGGVLLYHISNRYYDIQRPLARSAAKLDLAAQIQHYNGNPNVDPSDSPSRVVMIARNDADFLDLQGDSRWGRLVSDGGPLWTDDYANLLSILKSRP